MLPSPTVTLERWDATGAYSFRATFAGRRENILAHSSLCADLNAQVGDSAWVAREMHSRALQEAQNEAQTFLPDDSTRVALGSSPGRQLRLQIAQRFSARRRGNRVAFVARLR